MVLESLRKLKDVFNWKYLYSIFLNVNRAVVYDEGTGKKCVVKSGVNAYVGNWKVSRVRKTLEVCPYCFFVKSGKKTESTLRKEKKNLAHISLFIASLHFDLWEAIKQKCFCEAASYLSKGKQSNIIFKNICHCHKTSDLLGWGVGGVGTMLLQANLLSLALDKKPGSCQITICCTF